jgi:hypothetical protein
MVLQRKRRLFLLLGLTVALVLAVSPATASAQVFAVGGGTVGAGFPPEFDLSGSHFAFSAHCKPAEACTPSGGSATVSGYAVVSHPVLGKAQGHVCDFAALGGASFGFSAASFAIVVEGGSGPLASAPFLGFVAADFGPPSGPDPDALGVFPEEECVAIGAPSAFAVPIVQGNIVVKQ